MFNRKSTEIKSFESPEIHGFISEYLPRVVAMGVLGAVAVSALIGIHRRLSSETTVQSDKHNQSETV